MKIEFLELAEAIREQARGEPVHLLCNPGNWGDALIRFGTEQFLQTFGIAYRKLNLDGRMSSRLTLYAAGLRGGVLLCTGSGSWCGHFHYLPRAIDTIRQRLRFRQIIVLPSTYEKAYHMPGVLFFRRDQHESAAAMPGARFCHDLAFFIGSLESPAPTRERTHCFRTDVETAGKHALPQDNHDLSAHGSEASRVSPFLEYLADHREIHTDRLHVAIGGSLLGREVHLYPGRYFKNRAIFLSSLAPYFPHTQWHDDFAAPNPRAESSPTFDRAHP